jgi:hypothetical protein
VSPVAGAYGGDRLPWVAHDHESNFDTLAGVPWQVHVYGKANSPARAWCERHGVPLRVFDRAEYQAESGLTRDALYRLRSDTYVDPARGTGSADALDAYFRERGLVLAHVLQEG